MQEKDKMKQRINELVSSIKVSEEQQRDLENATHQFQQILFSHSNT